MIIAISLGGELRPVLEMGIHSLTISLTSFSNFFDF